MTGFVVAIDGAAGSGKSTTAKGVAKKLNFFYLDTGAMYRAVTLKYLQRGGDTGTINMELITQIIEQTNIKLQQENSETRVFLDGKDVTDEIRTPRVNNFVSPISAIPEIRVWMVDQQRKIAKEKNIVCEGRDIGTVVFPDAQVKIYMQADIGIRAQRRLKELKQKNLKVNLNEILGNLRFRDKYDSHREHSPLKKAEAAFVIDTTHMTIEQEIEEVEKIVKKHYKPHIY